MKPATRRLSIAAAGILLALVFGCRLFSRASGEMVLEATEVGTPVGGGAVKNIGPEGGSLNSPDRRLTLTVPPDALTETLSFSIQPITAMTATSAGEAYRLEPRGKTFSKPLLLSMHYGEKDLVGTIPQALKLAYQDENREWHVQTEAVLNIADQTISVPTTHFSDWSIFPSTTVAPLKATVRVGKNVDIVVTNCNGLGGILDIIFGDEKKICHSGWWYSTKWNLKGEGKLTGNYPAMTYTAPAKKPSPNVAPVVFSYEDDGHYEDVPCGSPVATNCRKWVHGEKQTFETTITITDGGYRAGGGDGPVSYSGTICSLDKPFTVIGTHPLIVHNFKFVPSGDGRSGTMSYSSGASGMTMSGNGPYVINGIETDSPEIVIQAASTARAPGASSSGSGVAHIHLSPLASNECDE